MMPSVKHPKNLPAGRWLPIYLPINGLNADLDNNFLQFFLLTGNGVNAGQDTD